MLLARVFLGKISYMRRKFFIFDTRYPDTLYLHVQGCGDPW
jgi:hypothetical protein